MSATNKRSKSLKNYSNSNPSKTLHENEENGYVQVFVRKEALVELQNIVNGIQNKGDEVSGLDIENISPNEMSTICSILSNCGILHEPTKR